MKSVKIADIYGRILVKVLRRKNGRYDIKVAKDIENKIDIDIRDDKNCRVILSKPREE